MVWALLLFFVGCSDDAAHSAAESRAIAGAAEEEPLPSSWPARVRPLDESLSALPSDRCVEALRQEMPVDVAEALSDIGYDTIYGDVCAGLEAVRSESAEACDELSVSPLRRGCRVRVALRAGRPNDCPPAPSHDGRDPTCVAWAARDPGLCRASRTDEETCRAVLARDEERCPRRARDRCRAEIQRFGAVLGDEREETAAESVEPAFELQASPSTPGSEPVTVERTDVRYGVVLEPTLGRCAHTLTLGRAGEAAPSVHAFLEREPTATLVMTLPATAEPPFDVPMGIQGARLRITMPGLGVADSTTGGRGKITVEALDRSRGGAVTLRVDADLAMTPARLQVRGTIRTFVRDLDPAPSCEGTDE